MPSSSGSRWSARGSASRNSVAADHRSVHGQVGRWQCNGRTLDADGESTIALNLDWPLHLQRSDVPICNLARRGAINLYGLWGTHNPPVVGSSPTRPTFRDSRYNLLTCHDSLMVNLCDPESDRLAMPDGRNWYADGHGEGFPASRTNAGVAHQGGAGVPSTLVRLDDGDTCLRGQLLEPLGHVIRVPRPPVGLAEDLGRCAAGRARLSSASAAVPGGALSAGSPSPRPGTPGGPRRDSWPRAPRAASRRAAGESSSR